MEKRRRGRPLKIDAKRKILSARISSGAASMVEYLLKEKHMTISEIIENGIKVVYNLAKYK